MKKKILGLLIALGLSVPTFASITVSPTRLEINANKARNNYVSVSVEVRGDSQKAVRYRAYSGYFAVADNGKMVIDASDTNNPHNIAKKVRFVPSEFTVPAGKTQRVRVNIADIKSLPDGESRAIILLSLFLFLLIQLDLLLFLYRLMAALPNFLKYNKTIYVQPCSI